MKGSFALLAVAAIAARRSRPPDPRPMTRPRCAPSSTRSSRTTKRGSPRSKHGSVSSSPPPRGRRPLRRQYADVPRQSSLHRRRGSTATAFNPAMSAILGGSYANLSEDPATYRIAGFLPAGDEIGPGDRSFNLGESEVTLVGQHRSVLHGKRDVRDDPGGRDRGRRGFLSDARAAFGPLAQGRTLLLRLRLPERVPRARLGLRRSAARVPGILRRPARAGRRAAQMACTDGPLSRARRGIRQRRSLSRNAARRERPQRHDALRARRRRHRRVGELACRRCRGSTCAPRIGLRGRRRARQSRSRTLLPATREPGSRMRRSNGPAPADPRRRSLKLQGEYMQRTEDGELAFDITGAALSDRYRSEQDGWYVQGVYQFRPRWRAGARYDALDSGTPAIGLVESGALTRRGFRAAVARHAKPNLADGRLEPERVLAPARADLLGRRARRGDRRAVLPAVHLLAGRARRPQVLGDPAMINIFARCA